MMKISLQPTLLSLLVLIAPSAIAQQQKFAVDPSTSQVGFVLGGSGHHVQGTFKVQSGSIEFDPSSHAMSGLIVVAAGSGNSNEPSRDKKMNSDVLNTDKFAEISFAPTGFAGSLASVGDSTIQVSGIFALHGSSHNITLPMQIHIDGSGLVAKGQFTVPYVQWGLKDPSIFILKVAKEVQIDLNLSGHLTR